MILSPSHSHVFSPLFSDPEMAQRFSEEQLIDYLLQVEVALARVQGRLGIIPTYAAEQIVSAVRSRRRRAHFRPDYAALQVSTEKAGVPVMGEAAGRTHSFSTSLTDYVWP